MNTVLEGDLARLPDILDRACKEALIFLNGVASRPVAIAPGVYEAVGLREVGVGFDRALEEFRARYAAALSTSIGPRYWGFVTGGATPASLAADWLVSAYDQNAMSGLDSSAPNLERETIAMLRQLFGLSNAHSGSFVTGATMSNVVGLALGREWIGEKYDIRVSEQGLGEMPAVRVFSGTPHSSIYKALSLLGIGRSSVALVPTITDREAVDVIALERYLRRENERPSIVVANAGTVNTADVDDLSAIVELKSRYPFWLHIDGAFGAFAALSEKYKDLVRGLDQADSLSIDAHKWLNVPYDSAVQFTRHQQLQLRVFQNMAAYLTFPHENPDFVHLTPENSRRMRALPVWFSLNAYGREGHQEIVERSCAMATLLGERVAKSKYFTLLAPVRMNVVCFTLIRQTTEGTIRQFVDKLRDGGHVLLTSTHYGGRWAIRAAMCNWRTQKEDLCVAWNAIEKTGLEAFTSAGV